MTLRWIRELDGNGCARQPFAPPLCTRAFLALGLGLVAWNPSAAAPILGGLLVDQAQWTNDVLTDRGFGRAVALDGDRAVVGVSGGDPFASVHVFERTGSTWQRLGRLSDSRAVVFDGFGRSVASSGDTIAVGDPTLNSAYAFVRTGGPGLNAWAITDNNSSAVGPSYIVSLVATQHAALQTNAWRYSVTARMVHDLGGSVCMYFSYGNTTRRWIFFLDFNSNGDLYAQLEGASPTQYLLTTNGVAADDYHLHEIEFDPATGMATYRFDGAAIRTWAGQATAGAPGIRWGAGSTPGLGSLNVHQVRFESLGTVLANYDAGTPENPSGSLNPLDQGWSTLVAPGTARTSQGPLTPDLGTIWIEQARLTDVSGASIDLDGDTMVVGDPFHGDGLGRVHVFVRQGSNWTRQALLTVASLGGTMEFGHSVAIDGDTILAGSPGRFSGLPTGRAYVFTRAGTNWTQAPPLVAPVPDDVSGNRFGESVDIRGDWLVIGAPGVGSRDGAIYVAERSGGSWGALTKLQASPVIPDDNFGAAVATTGDSIVVSGSYSLSSYLFNRRGSTWAQSVWREYPHYCEDEMGGVAIDGETFIVGVPNVGCSGEIGVRAGVVYVQTPDYADASAVANYVRSLLYYSDAPTSGETARHLAAFRYKHLLYGQSNGLVRARFENMAALYGENERRRASDAEQVLLRGLSINPNSALLRDLLLDIYYDGAVAETILAKGLLTQTEVARFGPPLAPPAGTSEFIIDNEIALRRQLLTTNKFALQGYFSLLTDDFGIPGDPPTGYRIFRDRVPTRALMAATYTNSSGANVLVSTNSMLFSGYKDLVLLFDLLREQGRAAHALSHLLVARDGAGDLNEAKAIISDNVRFLFLQGTLLKNIFPTLPAAGDPSGLAEAIQGWAAGLEALANLQHVIAGEVNLLGYAPDFLMLIENFQDPVNPLFDSFDSFKRRLSLSSFDSPLRRASDRLAEARTAYDQFKGYEDQIREQFDQSTVSYEFRLFEIVGARPGQGSYSDVPTNNPGSELDQQYRSIELARLKILRNQTEINNLAEEVRIEINRAMAVSNTVIRYGNQQAELTRQIGHIKAAQAAASALADAFSPEKLLTRGVVVGVLNAAAQAGAEEGIAGLEAQKEQLAAEEQAVVEGINSAAHVKTLLLGMRTLAVDSTEAALLLQQEVARMAALYREKSELEARIAERNTDLASRYFADPVHRLAAESSLVTANLNFADAQRWLFFAVRALEYKWNTTFDNFVYPPGGRTWSAKTLFKLRNADELVDFFDAMNAFDALINRGKTYRFDWFSVREDFMGLKLLNDLGQPATYLDPQTGRTLDAISLFRTNLLRTVQAVQGGRQVVLEFNTVRQIPGGFFFVGPTFDLNGNVINKGRFLDKIDYLQIRLPGNHTLGRPQLAGNLTYGGSSFIRNFNVGHFDPARPDRLIDELTAYSTRYWFYDPTPNQMRWRFNEGLTIDSVEMQLTSDPRIPPTVTQIEEFKERSVAATGWKLTIPLVQQNVTVLRLDELNDVEIYFHHYSAQRQ